MVGSGVPAREPDLVQLPTPAPRFLGLAGRDLLAGMRCTTGAWFEDEVENFIQTRLADYHDWRRPHPIPPSSASSWPTSGSSPLGHTNRI